MNYQTIDEIYSANDRAREKLIATVVGLDAESSNIRAGDGSWSVSEVVEHIAMVNQAASRICAKLLSAAKEQGLKFNGKAGLSQGFVNKAEEATSLKLEAPDVVQPTGRRSIAESLQTLSENRRRLEEIRPLFEEFDSGSFTFPHRFFGKLSAHEWLALIGAHEERHTAQIERLLKNSEQKKPGREEGMRPSE
jgi:uncharacterized damage-inducible protein DinB